MEKSRTINAIKNFNVGLFLQVVNKLVAFLVRTIFINMLNLEYLGINGLFSNVLNILSFAELGVGTAIIFNMYKPVAENDKEKIKSLLNLYKKCYVIIGLIIFLLGICVMPFLKFLIKDISDVRENMYLIYMLFLINTTLSYFFTYKRSIISAYQQERIINKIDSLFFIISSVFQIIFLFLTRNYIVYLIIQILTTLFQNIFISKKANDLFPFLKEKNIVKLNQEEKKSIFSNVKDLTIYKLGASVLSSTDNIILSSIISVSSVGLCSNYTLVIESVRGLLVSAFNGVTASIGNLNAVSSVDKKEKILYQYTLISFWIYSFCAIAFIVLLNPFINFWLGSKFVLPTIVPISLALSFWVCGMRGPAYTFRVTMGLFKKSKLAPIISSITNIILSIMLGKLIGISGIFFATSISQILSYSWIDPYIIYKFEFHLPLKKYWQIHMKYSCIFLLGIAITIMLTSFNYTNQFIDLLLKMIIVVLIPNILFLLFLYSSSEFKDIKLKLKNVKSI